MNGHQTETVGLRMVAEEVARTLAVATHAPEGSFIKTPLMYPGGSAVVVMIAQAPGGRYLVSDMGQAQDEADLMCAAPTFAHVAPRVAERNGVAFDRRAFFVVEVMREQLVGAVATIAGCSQEAVQITALKIAEARTNDAADLLYRRLAHVFTPARVARDAEIPGASTTRWHVTALVTVDGRPAVYDPVSSHPTAIAAAVTKYFDLAQLDTPPHRIAVVKSKAALGTRLGVIAGAARVVEDSVPDSTLERLARAA
ncbi:hypothetical protein [Roseospira navarrensis]|uniref:DUF1828 domain-containing protein n=1 Tax=Roseospira navarrensis TaxID=140058 RepID=A0A7X1ZI97_9PROT|nr:hypothetical protein [Roseospira navarrensis]MQX37952.1 hypothetical protein [Roseospira navarrensis]